MTECTLHINGQTYLVSEASHSFSSTDELTIEVMGLVKEWYSSSHFELSTSGSTGTPKRIKLKKDAVVQSAEGTAHFFDLPQGTKALCCLPLSKIAGRMMLYRSLVNGWELTIQPSSGNPLEEKKTFDFVALTPFQAHGVLDKNPAAFNCIQKVILGGAKVDTILLRAFERLSCSVWETYGMTETITHIAAKRISPNPQAEFHCLPGIQIRTTETDQLCISSSYFEEIVTNDLVQLKSPSSFVLLGRKDFVINSGGIKLYPEQIEAKLMGQLSDRFYITKSTHLSLGEQVTLVLESAPYSSQQKDTLKAKLRAVLSKYEMPKSIVFQPEFKETESGKIIRHTI